jgi:hypothetical protein
MVNGVRTDMVNERLISGRPRQSRPTALGGGKRPLGPRPAGFCALRPSL